jgi:hypothetical protein
MTQDKALALYHPIRASVRRVLSAAVPAPCRQPQRPSRRLSPECYVGDRPARQATDEIKVTPEMISAAQDAYWNLDERWHSSYEQFEADIEGP